MSNSQFNRTGGDHSALQSMNSSGLSKAWPPVVFLAGWYVLPSGRARNLYTLSWLGFVGGALTMSMYTGEGHAQRPFYENWTPTVWSYLLWILGVVCLVRMFIDISRSKRGGAPAQQSTVGTVEAPTAPAPVETAAPRELATVARAPAEASPVSKLWLPEPSRKVRRGGETLSGTPFNDRRASDRRNII
jgi:hypothetical protein